jgi:hypothetical protein
MKDFHRLIHALLVALSLLVFTACVSKEAEEEEEARDPREIRTELAAVQSELNAYLVEHKKLNEPGILQAVTAFREIAGQVQEDLRAHPELAPLILEGQEWMRQAAQARSEGNEETYRELVEKVNASRQSIEAKASEFPEFLKAEQDIQQAHLAVSRAMADVASGVDSQGQELADRLEELLVELQ